MTTMNYKNIIIIAFITLFFTTSCSDWLNVQPQGEITRERMYEKDKGFKEALAGCYTGMARQGLYGRDLTMTVIEDLACMWDYPSNELRLRFALQNHDYEDKNVKNTFESIYDQLYNLIVQANIIIYEEENRGDAITDPQLRGLIKGEAYGLRALYHMEVLRLFGQLPQGATIKRELIYSKAQDLYDKDNLKHIAFDEYVKLLKDDFDMAAKILKENDPVMTYSYEQLNNAGDKGYENVVINDNFKTFRQMRLNYWAIRALQARLYLYLGETQNAYNTAKEVINAQVGGKPVVTLSTKTDADNNYFGSPSEAFFLLNIPGLVDYTVNVLGGSSSARVDPKSTHLITTDMLEKELFRGQNTESDVRYNNIWNKNTQTSTSVIYPTIKKYYYDKDLAEKQSGAVALTKLQVVPVIRLSELYLIAMETTSDLSEANALYIDYMKARAVLHDKDPFTSLAEVHDAILDEYLREFYAEGIMFYQYKRKNTEKMKFQRSTMSEEQYILPVPPSDKAPEASNNN